MGGHVYTRMYKSKPLFGQALDGTDAKVHQRPSVIDQIVPVTAQEQRKMIPKDARGRGKGRGRGRGRGKKIESGEEDDDEQCESDMPQPAKRHRKKKPVDNTSKEGEPSAGNETKPRRGRKRKAEADVVDESVSLPNKSRKGGKKKADEKDEAKKDECPKKDETPSRPVENEMKNDDLPKTRKRNKEVDQSGASAKRKSRKKAADKEPDSKPKKPEPNPSGDVDPKKLEQKQRASRKSSAYHCAKLAAIREGKTEEEARALGKAVPCQTNTA